MDIKEILKIIFKSILECFMVAGIYVIGKEISDSYLCGTCVGILQMGGLSIARELSKK